MVTASSAPTKEAGFDQLVVSGLRVHFGGVKAVDGVDLVLDRGEIVGLIGPNGAGKTTLVNAVSGFQKPTEGALSLGGIDVTGWPPDRLASKGLTRTFQNVRLFGHLSVLENVVVAGVGMGLRRREAREQAYQLLEQFDLIEEVHKSADSLSAGNSRLLGLSRALATRPRLLLLDEAAAGLNDDEVDVLLGTLRKLPHDLAIGLLIIEHDMRLIMGVCERIYVLDYGKIIASGSPEEIKSNPIVLTAYLGDRSRNGST